MSFVHPPVLLDGNRRQLRSPRAAEHAAGDLHYLTHVFLVGDAVEKELIGRLLHIWPCLRGQGDQLFTVNVSQIDSECREEFLKEVNNVGDRAPLGDVGALKREELGGLVKHFAFADNELMQRVDIHQLVVGARRLNFGLFFAGQGQRLVLQDAVHDRSGEC